MKLLGLFLILFLLCLSFSAIAKVSNIIFDDISYSSTTYFVYDKNKSSQNQIFIKKNKRSSMDLKYARSLAFDIISKSVSDRDIRKNTKAKKVGRTKVKQTRYRKTFSYFGEVVAYSYFNKLPDRKIKSQIVGVILNAFYTTVLESQDRDQQNIATNFNDTFKTFAQSLLNINLRFEF